MKIELFWSTWKPKVLHARLSLPYQRNWRSHQGRWVFISRQSWQFWAEMKLTGWFSLFQIAHRFYQLMKLYKKQEKMDTWSPWLCANSSCIRTFPYTNCGKSSMWAAVDRTRSLWVAGSNPHTGPSLHRDLERSRSSFVFQMKVRKAVTVQDQTVRHHTVRNDFINNDTSSAHTWEVNVNIKQLLNKNT